MNKQFTVITGPVYAPKTHTVELPGVLPRERLTPRWRGRRHGRRGQTGR